MRTFLDVSDKGVFVRTGPDGNAMFLTPSKLSFRDRRLAPELTYMPLADIDVRASAITPNEVVRGWARWISQSRGALTDLHIATHSAIRDLLVPEVYSELAEVLPEPVEHPLLGMRIHERHAEAASNMRLETGNNTIRVRAGHVIAATVPPAGIQLLVAWDGARRSAGAKNGLILRTITERDIHQCGKNCYFCPTVFPAGLRRLFVALHGAFYEDLPARGIPVSAVRWINAATWVLALHAEAEIRG